MELIPSIYWVLLRRWKRTTSSFYTNDENQVKWLAWEAKYGKCDAPNRYSAEGRTQINDAWKHKNCDEWQINEFSFEFSCDWRTENSFE